MPKRPTNSKITAQANKTGVSLPYTIKRPVTLNQKSTIRSHSTPHSDSKSMNKRQIKAKNDVLKEELNFVFDDVHSLVHASKGPHSFTRSRFDRKDETFAESQFIVSRFLLDIVRWLILILWQTFKGI